jgi:putative chitinase
MLNITADMLNSIAPGGDPTIVNGLVPYLNQYLPAYGIDTLDRMKHFFGQAAEESASFRTLTEYASGAEYEGRLDLGNTQPGDGVKFKGRGIFQITGRSNYTAIGKQLGIDLVDNPALAATPQVAVETACIYWNTHNLSALADSSMSAYNTCVAITKLINGGVNGLAVRWQMTQKATTVLPPAIIVTPIATPAPVPVIVPSVPVSTGPAVFPTPVTKPVEVPTQASVDAAAVDAVDNSSPLLYAVHTVEVFVKKFF